MPKRVKFTFILRHVDTHMVDVKFGFNLVSNLGEKDVREPKKFTTKIKDLPRPNNPEDSTFSFLDESKQNHSCVTTMHDLISGERLPHKTELHCFWCRSYFDSCPLGCPIRFIPGKVTKCYYSEITKDNYKITDNITTKRKELIQKLMEKHQSKFSILDNHQEFFIVDGIFCSFNCCMAFIKSKSHENFFNESENLLYALYGKIFGTTTSDISPAPHWRLLLDYGGNLSLEEFRKSFETISFNDIDDYIHSFPPCRIIGRLYEKKIRF